MLRLATKDIVSTLNDLRPILDVPEGLEIPIRLHHPSFRDFLLDKERCKDPMLWVDDKQAHQMLAYGCVRLMSSSLQQDICCIGDPGTLTTDVMRSCIEQYLPLELQYACLYWIQHLQQCNVQLRDDDEVHQFLREYLLYWFEALGWMGKLSEGIHAIALLETSISVSILLAL
jgi:hypothetical protein